MVPRWELGIAGLATVGGLAAAGAAGELLQTVGTEISFSPAAASLAVAGFVALGAAVGVVFRSLVAAKDAHIAALERESAQISGERSKQDEATRSRDAAWAEERRMLAGQTIELLTGAVRNQDASNAKIATTLSELATAMQEIRRATEERNEMASSEHRQIVQILS